ncbi:hypothetical protein IMY05_C2442001000 [Salix suchowensis]|nr:hypothetical protein IMY05_C2442001000 [Salix suchowensis]
MVLSGKQEICAWFKLPAQSSQAPRAQTTSMDAPSLSTQSPSAQPSRPIDESVMQATWMIRLGWTNYLESLGTGMLVETLMQLATPLYSSMNIPVCPSNTEYLELGLRVLNRELGSYFMNSNNFLNSRHASLRSAVVARSAKSKFHDIRMETMQKYRWPLVMTLAFMTCFLQRKADGTTQGFGLFKIEGHPSQIEAADALRKHFLHQKGVPNIQTMCQLMHSVFVALLCPPHLKDAAIACPTDQALLLLALAGPGHFTPVISVINVESADVDVDDVDEEDPIGGSSDSGYEGTDSELQPGPHASKGADIPEFSDQVTKFLEKMGSWVSTVVIKAINTPYQRNKAAMFILTPWTRQKYHSSLSFSISRNSQVLELSDSHDDPLSVNLQRWRSVTIELITSALSDAVSSMIPEACRETVQAFNFCDIIDDFTPHPVYRQEANAARLSVLIDLIVTTLLTPSTSNCCLVDSNGRIIDDRHLTWLKREQNLLGIVVAIFVLASGPCFRSFQFSKLQYCGTPERDRNLYFFSSTFIGLANPPAKQINARIAPTTLLFPPSASTGIRIYFFVLRAVGERLLCHAGKDIPRYSTTIWVNTLPDHRRKNQKYEWTGTDIDSAVKNLTTRHLGFGLSCATV